MCECGCGETNGLVRVPGPEGVWHIVEVYPGCRDCGTDWALGLVEAREDDEWWGFYEHVPVVEYNDLRMWGRPILKLAVVQRLFQEEYGSAAMGDGADAYPDSYTPEDAMSDFLSGGGLRTAHHESLRERDDERR